MANIKKQYPRILYGIIKEDERGYSLCQYILNEEKRIKLLKKDPPEVLYIVLDRLNRNVYSDLEKEVEYERQERNA